MAAVIANPTALSAVVSSSTAMTAVAASHVAVAAVWGSTAAVSAVKANTTAWATLTGTSSAVMGKAVAIIVGLDPAGYADMTAVAASSTAMTAVAASSTAMAAVAASSTAMTAVAASSTAMSAVGASSTALDALFNSPLAVVTAASSWGTPAAGGTLISGKRILVGFSQKQYNTGTNSSTLGTKTGGSGSGDFSIAFGTANYNTYQKMAIVVNPLLWRSNTWGGNFSSTYINGVKTIPIS